MCNVIDSEYYGILCNANKAGHSIMGYQRDLLAHCIVVCFWKTWLFALSHLFKILLISFNLLLISNIKWFFKTYVSDLIKYISYAISHTCLLFFTG